MRTFAILRNEYKLETHHQISRFGWMVMLLRNEDKNSAKTPAAEA